MTAPPDAAWTLEMVMDLQDRVSNIEQWVTARIGEDMRVCNHARGHHGADATRNDEERTTRGGWAW